MDERIPQAARSAGDDVSAQPGVIGIALAGVLAAALAQGSWQWFATYVGLTLLAVVFALYRLPRWAPGLRNTYLRNLAAYSLVVGLCVAITLAPMMQRWAWLFPMPGTRDACPGLGAYASLRARAELGVPAARDPAALARAQAAQSRTAVAECLSATTTLWLPVYAAAVALLVALVAWLVDRARTRNAVAAAG